MAAIASGICDESEIDPSGSYRTMDQKSYSKRESEKHEERIV